MNDPIATAYNQQQIQALLDELETQVDSDLDAKVSQSSYNVDKTNILLSLSARYTKAEVDARLKDFFLFQTVANEEALLAAATGDQKKIIVCLSDPDYSDTDPVYNVWDGTNLIALAGEKRN